MQHTLIPFKDRKRLHREYVLRVLAVALFAFSVSMIVGVVAMFPAFIRGQFYSGAAQGSINEIKETQADRDISDIKGRLAADGKLLAALSVGVPTAYSDVVRSLVSVRGAVEILSFKLDRPDAKSISISIKGTAPTRAELIMLKGRLEVLMPGTKVDIPIDQLARNINPSFDLRFVKQLP